MILITTIIDLSNHKFQDQYQQQKRSHSLVTNTICKRIYKIISITFSEITFLHFQWVSNVICESFLQLQDNEFKIHYEFQQQNHN